MVAPRPVVGVLALQGDVVEHARALERVGADVVAVRDAATLAAVDGIVLPGGESTTVGMLLARFELLEPLRSRIAEGMPVYGTCTGLILLAREAVDGLEGQPLLGCMDVRVQRNGYGRQLQSFEAPVDVSLAGSPEGPFPAVFIRAPKIISTGPAVEILARHDAVPVAVRERHMLASSFHPELTEDLRMHAFFAAMCQSARSPE